MKTKSLKLAVILFLGLTVFDSCKKGENDPAISLRSRDARITGEWKLVELDATSSYVSTTVGFGAGSSSFIETTKFDGTTLTHTSPSGSQTSTFSLTITMEKDGSYVDKSTQDGDSYEETGRWNWLSDAKNKTRVSIDGIGTYVVDQLKNSEMVLIDNTESTDVETDTFGGQSSTTTTVSKSEEKLVFEKQ